MDMKLYQNILNKRGHTKFHMPGHKGRKLSEHQWEYLDTTELAGTDNLNDPKAEIRNLEREISTVYGAKESMIVVNGATCCIMASMLGAFEPGDEIVIPRNVHKSVYSALYYGRFSPIYVHPDFQKVPGYPSGVCVKDLEAAINANPRVKGMVITYPTYYGTCDDIWAIVKLCKERNVVLIVDEAHGAHFHFSNKLPVSALDAGADVVIHSTHKTLSSLNQGALLHINSPKIDSGRVRRHLAMLQTSSPSYPILLSVAHAVSSMEEHGPSILEFLGEMNQMVRKRLRNGPFPMVRDIWAETGSGWDPTKIWFATGGMDHLSNILSERFHIDVEWEDGRTCLAMSGVGSVKEDFDQLVEALQRLGAENPGQGELSSNPTLGFPRPGRKVLELHESRETENVPLEQSIGRISADFLTPYPPGIPIVCPGEVIGEEMVEYIRRTSSGSTLGLGQDGRILVCKEEK